jgi:hypothetical protein
MFHRVRRIIPGVMVRYDLENCMKRYFITVLWTCVAIMPGALPAQTPAAILRS